MQVCTVVAGKVASIASGNPIQPVDAADQDVLCAALLQIGQDLHPELRALVSLEPHAEYFALTVQVDRQRQITCPALHAAAIADLQHQRVEEHDRIDVIQRPCLPRPRVVHNRVGDPADQVTANFDAVDGGVGEGGVEQGSARS